MSIRDELYAVANEFLVEQGFVFEHAYWILDNRVHEIPESVDCDSPGIMFFHSSEDDSSIAIASVVNEGDISYLPSGVGKIVVRNKQELTDALIVLIELIKNWHERLIKLEEKLGVNKLTRKNYPKLLKQSQEKIHLIDTLTFEEE